MFRTSTRASRSSARRTPAGATTLPPRWTARKAASAAPVSPATRATGCSKGRRASQPPRSRASVRQGNSPLLPPAPPYYPFPRGKTHTRGSIWSMWGRIGAYQHDSFLFETIVQVKEKNTGLVSRCANPPHKVLCVNK